MDSNYNFYDNAPAGYPLCLNGGCTSAGSCLRQLAARQLSGEPRFVTIVNPKLADTGGDGVCPFFRKAEMVRVAYGFKQALAGIESGKVAGARAAIGAMMSRRNFYYLLNGKTPLYPERQQRIAAVMQHYGLRGPVEFDRYEWRYLW